MPFWRPWPPACCSCCPSEWLRPTRKTVRSHAPRKQRPMQSRPSRPPTRSRRRSRRGRMAWYRCGDAAFTIEGGVLSFAKSARLREAPRTLWGTSNDSTAAAGDNSYEITVKAMDEHRQDRRQEGGDGRCHRRGRAWHGDPLGAASPRSTLTSPRAWPTSTTQMRGRGDQRHVAVGQVQQQERLVHRHRRRRG